MSKIRSLASSFVDGDSFAKSANIIFLLMIHATRVRPKSQLAIKLKVVTNEGLIYVLLILNYVKLNHPMDDWSIFFIASAEPWN